MEKRISSQFAAADAPLGSATDTVAAAIQFVREVAEEHAAKRVKTPLELPLAPLEEAPTLDELISPVPEHVRHIARGEGPPERQQFSLGSELSWNPGRALPQFLFQGKPILLTDPEQLARWDRLARQEAEDNVPGPMAQTFNFQSKAVPPDISTELERSAKGKIVFQSADRPGWDKVIYYHAGEKGAAERLAEILRNNQELTEQQQAEAWRLEGWPEADVARELGRIRNVRRMHDESWWTPPPSLVERARQCAKNLLWFGPAKENARTFAKAELIPAQRPLRLAQRAPVRTAELVLAEGVPLDVAEHAETERNGVGAERAPKGAFDPAEIMDFRQTDMQAAARRDLDRMRANPDVKIPAAATRSDEPVFRWLEAAMEDVHRHAQRQRSSLKRQR